MMQLIITICDKFFVWDYMYFSFHSQDFFLKYNDINNKREQLVFFSFPLQDIFCWNSQNMSSEPMSVEDAGSG